MKHGIDSIVFDLDGTLWDTCGSCAIAWNNVAKRHGISFREILADDVRRVAGLPHEECIRRTFEGVTEKQIAILIEDTMVEDNVMVAQHGGDLYEGVLHGLPRLAAAIPLFIVSNCQSGYIEIFLKKYGLEDLFADFECWGNTGEPKADNLKKLILRNNLRTPVMVGDTEGDGKAAEENKIPFWHVSYGFGEASSPTQRFSSFTALANFVFDGA